MTTDAPRQLPPCPNKPNCVSSQAPPDDALHAIAPLACAGDPDAAWAKLRQAIGALPRTRIVMEEAGYLRAEATSLIFRFVDDLECSLDRTAGVIHLRSASRVGYGDLGVNRKRVERLRALFAAGQRQA
jgi:uncharacterized protein (DUF1499 family)